MRLLVYAFAAALLWALTLHGPAVSDASTPTAGAYAPAQAQVQAPASMPARSP